MLIGFFCGTRLQCSLVGTGEVFFDRRFGLLQLVAFRWIEIILNELNCLSEQWINETI